ncbi:MAG TPA: hypothetical protein VF261_01505 [Candidatus Saccharimonadales bacterium]
MPDATLIGLIVIPAFVLVLLRVNAAIVFLSLCLGSVLVQFVGGDVQSVVNGASTSPQLSSNTIRLAVLTLPAILTLLFMIRTVRPPMRFLNILPAIGTGFLTLLLVVPMLSPGLGHDVVHSNLWSVVQSVRPAIVAASAIICLLFLWLGRPKNHESKHSKHQ